MVSMKCDHPADRRSTGVMDPESTYCAACDALIFPDGRVEPVRITGFYGPRRTTRNGSTPKDGGS